MKARSSSEFIDCGRPDRYVGMDCTHPFDALSRADQADQPYLLSPSLFKSVYRRNRGICGRKDWNNDNYEALAEIGWRLEEVLHRRESLRLPIEPDMGHARCWNEIKHSFGKCQTSTQNRGKYEFLTRDAIRNHARQRRFNLHRSQRKVARNLVAEQHPYLFQKLPKRLC